ncbi:SDR family NAD(P)-dependent oxidoreductase [Cellulomonas xiejunii]|uniref:SDR family NAD(P)-dependent oxidoreductase n=1 Tax=Cellulomonas xiejunii TaxID=2968083 RepID=UPI001D0E7207|nr:SDR family NAD(P)-dependent oxidoreductase [Cellulomonas xiejunii]MCC2313510.1 SDR family NAD(P)-dependent oxidoreductase [Cellulomonas xiejunii]
MATVWDLQRVQDALGEHENLLPVALDVTDPAAAEAAVAAAIERFARIDVLANNAGNFRRRLRGAHLAGHRGLEGHERPAGAQTPPSSARRSLPSPPSTPCRGGSSPVPTP